MGAVPKSRIGPRRRRLRRTHYRAAAVRLVPCDTCGALRPAHRVCRACGSYKGVQIVKQQEES
jgi:large subunit ribosomal protein L32